MKKKSNSSRGFFTTRRNFFSGKKFSFFAIILLLVAIPVTIALTKQQTQLEQHASLNDTIYPFYNSTEYNGIWGFSMIINTDSINNKVEGGTINTKTLQTKGIQFTPDLFFSAYNQADVYLKVTCGLISDKEATNLIYASQPKVPSNDQIEFYSPNAITLHFPQSADNKWKPTREINQLMSIILKPSQAKSLGNGFYIVCSASTKQPGSTVFTPLHFSVGDVTNPATKSLMSKDGSFVAMGYVRVGSTDLLTLYPTKPPTFCKNGYWNNKGTCVKYGIGYAVGALEKNGKQYCTVGITGWACNGINDTPVEVGFYNGPYKPGANNYLGSTMANVATSPKNADAINNGFCGGSTLKRTFIFSPAQIPNALADGKPHQIYAYVDLHDKNRIHPFYNSVTMQCTKPNNNTQYLRHYLN